jgi:hypothetical protein
MDKKTSRTSARAAPSDSPPRTTYAAPSLRVYGDIAALTRTVGRTSSNRDGGAMWNMSKTH